MNKGSSSTPSQVRILIPAIIASQFAPPFMFSGVAVALPAMGKELSLGASSLGLVETLFLAMQLAFLLPGGRLADNTDKRTLYKAGMFGFGVCSLAIGFISTVTLVLFLRIVQGGTSALLAVSGPAILNDIAPEDKRGRVFGASIGAIYAGLTLGPVFAGAITDLWGWRGVFFCGGTLLLADALVVSFFLRSSWRRPPAGALHLPSTAYLVTAVLCFVLGGAEIKEGFAAYAALAVSGVLLSGFFRSQRSAKEPLINFQLLQSNRVLRASLVIQLLLYLNAFSSVYLLNLYLQSCVSLSAKIAGRIMAVSSVLMALIAPGAGRLSERFSPRTIAGVGVVAVFAATVIGTVLDDNTDVPLVVILLVLQGVGYGLFSSPNTMLIMSSVERTLGGTASALSAKARSLGMVGGMVLSGAVVSLVLGDRPVQGHAADFIQAMRIAFGILVLATGAALALSVAKSDASGVPRNKVG